MDCGGGIEKSGKGVECIIGYGNMNHNVIINYLVYKYNLWTPNYISYINIVCNTVVTGYKNLQSTTWTIV